MTDNVTSAYDSSALAQTRVISGTVGQQRFDAVSGISPVRIGADMHVADYSPLANVAFAPHEDNFRNFTNLFHPAPVTGGYAQRTDQWNPFATLQNWPMKAVAGLRTTIFGGPQSASPRGTQT